MKQNRREINIVDYIPKGKSNRVSITQLCNATGIRDKRTVRDMIATARLNNIVILSNRSSGGYWLPDPQDSDFRQQIMDYCHSNKRQAISTFKALRTASKLLDMPLGQIGFNDLEPAAGPNNQRAAAAADHTETKHDTATA